MHPRSSYLAASGEEDSIQEPLLAHEDYPVLLPDVEPSASSSTSPAKAPEEIKVPSPGKGQDSDQKANPSPTSITPEKAEGYGLPTGYQAQYAGKNSQLLLPLPDDKCKMVSHGLADRWYCLSRLVC